MSNGQQSWQVRVIRVSFRMLVLLVIDIAVQVINLEIIGLQKYLAPVIVTTLGMILVIALFYFLISYIEQMTNVVLKYVIELGKTFKYRKTAVMLILLVLYLAAFSVYYKLWFNKWVGFTDIPKLFSGPLIR